MIFLDAVSLFFEGTYLLRKISMFLSMYEKVIICKKLFDSFIFSMETTLRAANHDQLKIT